MKYLISIKKLFVKISSVISTNCLHYLLEVLIIIRLFMKKRWKMMKGGNFVEYDLIIWLFRIQVRTQPLNDFEGEVFSANAAMDFLNKEDSNGTLIDFIKNRKKQFSGNSDEGSTQKQQILEELHVSTSFYFAILAFGLILCNRNFQSFFLKLLCEESHNIFCIIVPVS